MKKKKVKFKSDPKAEKWAQRNYWFGKNKTLTYLAFDIHKDLIKNFVTSRSVKLKKIYKNRNTVRLTAAQILIAKKLKVPLKQYARKI